MKQQRKVICSSSHRKQKHSDLVMRFASDGPEKKQEHKNQRKVESCYLHYLQGPESEAVRMAAMAF